MMKKPYRVLIAICSFLAVAHVFVPVAAAHPLGNFTVNHYAGLHIGQDGISIDYVLDMAEIPAFQEISSFDSNRNRQPDPEETAAYHPAQCEAIRSNLELRLNDRPARLNLATSAVDFPPGVGGLPTLRLTCAFHASRVPASETVQLEFKNNVYPERLGWREIVVSSDGVSLHGSLEEMRHSLSQRLSAYPDDLLASPLNQRQVAFEILPISGPGQQPSQPALQPSPSLSRDGDNAFTQLVTTRQLTPLSLLLALAIAFVWGAMHAMTPGHGKTIVGAYLVGARGTPRHALYLGLTTTITHTAGVFALGLVTLFAARFIVPEQLYPWLSVLSGLLVVLIGLNLFASRLNAARRAAPGTSSHDHTFPTTDHRHHIHHHHDHDHAHDHQHEHSHEHSHLPPGADGSPVTWRNLLALGISGGLLPCPSALVVLLSAISLQRVGFGLVLVLAFSLGLAGLLTGIGLLLVYAGRLFAQLPAQSRAIRLLPAASALFIAVVGAGISIRALAQMGLFQL